MYQTLWINKVPKEVRQAKRAAWKAKRDADKEARSKFLRTCAAYSLKRRYGLTEHQIVELAAYQGNVCAICGRPPDMSIVKGSLRVDHSHSTGQMRGLLCESCNLGLGFFKDNPTSLVRAAEYLQSPPFDKVKFTEEEPRPEFAPSTRNPEKLALLKLACRQCGKPLYRVAKDEHRIRTKGKEGPFCSQGCANAWYSLQHGGNQLVHGTTTGYTSYKCRCAECRKAHADYERGRLHSKKGVQK